MSSFWINASFLGIVALFLIVLALALLWRVSSWYVSQVESIVVDEGLALGSRAPEIAARRGADEYHLTFGGVRTFLVFGTAECRPCNELLELAPSHPAIEPLRRVFVSDVAVTELPAIIDSWETYELDDSLHTRRQWRAPVSPYFYVVDIDQKVIAKGIANRAEHLDRLLTLPPTPRGKWRNFDTFKPRPSLGDSQSAKGAVAQRSSESDAISEQRAE